jgi:hypothetical protein
MKNCGVEVFSTGMILIPTSVKWFKNCSGCAQLVGVEISYAIFFFDDSNV